MTLKPARQPNIHDLFRLTVFGPGTPRPNVAADVSNGNTGLGEPGSKVVAIISVADLVETSKNPAFLRHDNWVLGQQVRKLKHLGLD